MKITPNVIGNYSPYTTGKVKQVNQTANTAKVNELKNTDTVTNDEKKFFTNLYPDSKQEIVDYHFYKRTGKMDGVALGSIFDKRG